MPPRSKSHTGSRRSKGFTQTNALVSDRIRAATGMGGFSQTRLLTDWVEIAGVSIAKVARPVKVGYTRQGLGATLTLLVDGANAPMIQMQLPTLIERVNACYGYAAINRIRLAQTSATGFAEPASAFDAAPATKRDLTPDQRKRVELEVAEVADTALQSALSRLGENIVKKRSDRT